MSFAVQVDRLIQRVYDWALRFYPHQFRSNYQAQMLQCLRDAMADPQLSQRTLLSILIFDLSRSLVKENLAMLRDAFARPALIYNALVLAALSTVLALGFYAVPQTLLRQSLNDPQIELTGNLASEIQNGASPQALIPSHPVDMNTSLSPFVIAYDEHGHVLASSGQLDGVTPPLPAGVFDYVRQHGEERVTWQPRHGVRIASVVRHISGGGFVLAGRNMREGEARIDHIFTAAQLMLLAMLSIIVGATLVYGWMTRTVRPVAA